MQADIDFEPEPAPVRGDLRALTAEWMDRNPRVVAMFESYALSMAAKGRPFGINLLRERVRWDCAYSFTGEVFKFCNSFSPYVARELIRRHPQLKPFIRFRRTKDEA